MIEAFWLGANLLVGVPLAAAIVVTLREPARAVMALALGFRVFEIKWGAGRRIATRAIGPLDLVLGALPLSVSILAESGSARHHLRGRLIQAAGPLALQVGLGLWLDRSLSSVVVALSENVAPWACLHVANSILVAVHALLPLRSAAGDRTDVRWVLDEVFGAAEESRHARARYYARSTRHALERGDVAGAIGILDRGLVQLGRDPLLVACEEHVRGHDLVSVVDQGECADALRDLIEDDVPLRPGEPGTDPTPWIRVRRAAIALLPLTLVGLGALAIHPEVAARFLHARLVASSAAVATAGAGSDCEDELVRWGRWMGLLDLALASDATALRDRHAQLARLERCRGDLDAAIAHQLRANAAAEAAVVDHLDALRARPAPWLADELELIALLRQTAEIERDRRGFRRALAALGAADQRLERVRRRLAGVSAPDRTGADGPSLEIESARIASTRHGVFDRMRRR